MGMLWKSGIIMVAFSTILGAAEPVLLFNGKNLDGWTPETISETVKPETVWSVVDGILICKGRPPGLIRTTREFSNYELSVEWRWAPKGKPGNSGVLIHASKPKELFAWPKSIEVQLAHGDAGDFWEIGETLQGAGVEAKERRWIKKGVNPEKPPGEWNLARIRCEGDRASVWINGVLVNEGTKLSATQGAICLQSEEHEVHFRRVELRQLD